MGNSVKFWCITYILATVTMVNGGRIQAKTTPSAPTPSPTDCSDLVYDMVDCMAFFGTYSNATKPTHSCCIGFKTVLDTNSKCICAGLEGAINLGLPINVTKAGTLPSFCHLNGPPISTCDLSTPPVPSPANPPSVANPPESSQTPAISPVADSPMASKGTSTMPMFLVSSIMVIASFLA